MPRRTAKSVKVENENNSVLETSVGRKSARQTKRKSNLSPAALTPVTIVDTGRSRRSSTAAQTAASVADFHSNRSYGSRRSSESSDSNARSREVSEDGSSSRAHAKRAVKEVNYVESDGDEEVVKTEALPEDEYNAEEDVESDSGDSTKGKRKIKAFSTPTSSRRKQVSSRSPRSTKGSAKRGQRGKGKKEVVDTPKPRTPSRRGRYAKKISDDEENEEEDSAMPPKTEITPKRSPRATSRKRARYTEPETDEESDNEKPVENDSDSGQSPINKQKAKASDDNETNQVKKSVGVGKSKSTRATRAAKRNDETKSVDSESNQKTPRAQRGRRKVSQDAVDIVPEDNESTRKRKSKDNLNNVNSKRLKICDESEPASPENITDTSDKTSDKIPDVKEPDVDEPRKEESPGEEQPSDMEVDEISGNTPDSNAIIDKQNVSEKLTTVVTGNDTKESKRSDSNLCKTSECVVELTAMENNNNESVTSKDASLESKDSVTAVSQENNSTGNLSIGKEKASLGTAELGSENKDIAASSEKVDTSSDALPILKDESSNGNTKCVSNDDVLLDTTDEKCNSLIVDEKVNTSKEDKNNTPTVNEKDGTPITDKKESTLTLDKNDTLIAAAKDSSVSQVQKAENSPKDKNYASPTEKKDSSSSPEKKVSHSSPHKTDSNSSHSKRDSLSSNDSKESYSSHSKRERDKRDSYSSHDKRDSYLSHGKRDTHSSRDKRDSHSSSEKKDSHSPHDKRDSSGKREHFSSHDKRDKYFSSEKRDKHSPDKRDSYSPSNKRDSHSSHDKRDVHSSGDRQYIGSTEKRDVARSTPEKAVAIHSPEKGDAIHSPEKKDTIHSPEKSDALNSPEKSDAQHSPEKRDALHSPEKRDALHSPEKKDALHSPEKRDAAHSPEKRDAAHSPEKKGAVLSPEKRDAVLTPEEAILAPEKKDVTLTPEKNSVKPPAETKDARVKLARETKETGLDKDDHLVNAVHLTSDKDSETTHEKKDTILNPDKGMITLDKVHVIPLKDFEVKDSKFPLASENSEVLPKAGEIKKVKTASGVENKQFPSIQSADCAKMKELYVSGLSEVHSSSEFNGIFYGRKYVINQNVSDESWVQCFNRTLGVVSYNLGGEAPKPLENFVASIKLLKSELVCLQGVNGMFHRGYLEATMDGLGYKGLFVLPDDCTVGFSIFFKSTIIKLKTHCVVSLKQAISKELESSLPDVHKVLLQQIPACGTVLLANFELSLPDNQIQNFIVASVNIPQSDLSSHALQMSCLAREALNFMENPLHPLIICGAFNMVSSESSYQLLKDGYLSNEMIDTLQSRKDIKVPGKENTALVDLLWKSFQHSATGLKCCYSTVLGQEVPMPSTSEMIWYSSSCLHTLSILDVLADSKSQENSLSFNKHVMLKANIAFAK